MVIVMLGRLCRRAGLDRDGELLDGGWCVRLDRRTPRAAMQILTCVAARARSAHTISSPSAYR